MRNDNTNHSSLCHWHLFSFFTIRKHLLGLTFAATSVSISVAVLQEMGRLNSKEGLTILGAAVVDDLLSILLLSVATSMIRVATAKNSAGLKLILAIFLQILYLFLLAFSASR
ncbi:cation:proton antiporter [Lactobacillus sp. R2/2]|nr:cation:proton antiporter [Lactobacillus sp. R2/2]